MIRRFFAALHRWYARTSLHPDQIRLGKHAPRTSTTCAAEAQADALQGQKVMKQRWGSRTASFYAHIIKDMEGDRAATFGRSLGPRSGSLLDNQFHA
jgi:hypothetical protein